MNRNAGAHSTFRKLERNDSLEKTEIGGEAGQKGKGEFNNIRKSH